MQYIAEIVEDATGKAVWQSKPTSERRAEKIADGASINLDWENFSVRVVRAQEWPEHDVDPEDYRHARDERDEVSE